MWTNSCHFCLYSAEVYDNFDESDVDEDSSLSMEEITMYNLPLSQEAFDLLDSDGDGKVSKSELKTTLHLLKSSQEQG